MNPLNLPYIKEIINKIDYDFYKEMFVYGEVEDDTLVPDLSQTLDEYYKARRKQEKEKFSSLDELSPEDQDVVRNDW